MVVRSHEISIPIRFVLVTVVGQVRKVPIHREMDVLVVGSQLLAIGAVGLGLVLLGYKAGRREYDQELLFYAVLWLLAVLAAVVALD